MAKSAKLLRLPDDVKEAIDRELLANPGAYRGPNNAVSANELIITAIKSFLSEKSIQVDERTPKTA